jgi:hypothetical protein
MPLSRHFYPVAGDGVASGGGTVILQMAALGGYSSLLLLLESAPYFLKQPFLG